MEKELVCNGTCYIKMIDDETKKEAIERFRCMAEEIGVIIGDFDYSEQENIV